MDGWMDRYLHTHTHTHMEQRIHAYTSYIRIIHAYIHTWIHCLADVP